MSHADYIENERRMLNKALELMKATGRSSPYSDIMPTLEVVRKAHFLGYDVIPAQPPPDTAAGSQE